MNLGQSNGVNSEAIFDEKDIRSVTDRSICSGHVQHFLKIGILAVEPYLMASLVHSSFLYVTTKTEQQTLLRHLYCRKDQVSFFPTAVSELIF
jgi:hypothetical protein